MKQTNIVKQDTWDSHAPITGDGIEQYEETYKNPWKSSKDLLSTMLEEKKNNLSKEYTLYDRDNFLRKIVASVKRMCELKYKIVYTPKYIRIEENVSHLQKRYVIEFSRSSRAFESWAEQRRLTIKKLRKVAKEIESLKLAFCKSRLTFSAADAIGSVGAIVMNYVKPDLAPKVLLTAGFLGCVGFACSVADHVKTNSIMEDVFHECKADIESFAKIRKMFHTLNDFYDSLEDFFPYHVDLLSVEALKLRQKFEPNARKEFKTITEDLFPHEKNMDICLAILISNGRKDPKLLEDDEFLVRTLIFSRTQFAEKWWNRTTVENRLLSSYPKGANQLRSLMVKDPFPITSMPLLTISPVYMHVMSTAVALVLNSLVAIDASLQLARKESTKESEICRKLEQVLLQEFKEYEAIYDMLNPYND